MLVGGCVVASTLCVYFNNVRFILPVCLPADDNARSSAPHSASHRQTAQGGEGTADGDSDSVSSRMVMTEWNTSTVKGRE
jgi:hypothetical protein